MLTAAERVISQNQQLRVDPTSDALLDQLITALCLPFEMLVLIAFGDPALGIQPGQVLTDPAVAPLELLPHAAQYTGGRMPARLPGEPDADYLLRARISVVRPRGMIRGTADALAETARTFLTGAKYVAVFERVNDDPWQVNVLTRTSQTPNPAAVLTAITDPEVIPAGVQVTLTVSDAPIIDEWTREIDATTALIDDLTVPDVT